MMHSDCLRLQKLPAQNKAYSKLIRALFFTEAQLCYFSNKLRKSVNKHLFDSVEEG